MLAELLQKSSLFSLLHRIDTDLANQCRERGCPFCGGPLHQATYQRKPRGGPVDLPEECLIRQSLCCGRENCRRRCLPASCLFMGRRVYWAGVILVVMALRQNRLEGSSTSELMRMFDMSRKTRLQVDELFPEKCFLIALNGKSSAGECIHRLETANCPETYYDTLSVMPIRQRQVLWAVFVFWRQGLEVRRSSMLMEYFTHAKDG